MVQIQSALSLFAEGFKPAAEGEELKGESKSERVYNKYNMAKRVFIVHGWGGNPNVGWFVWLKKELSSKGFKVYSPEMPDSDNPAIEPWVNHLKEVVGKTDKNTYFVGHSIGCQAIMRLIEGLPDKSEVGGAVFVAGFFDLVGLETEEERKVAEPWLKTKIDLDKVKGRVRNIVAIFSNNDPFVPVSNAALFKDKLGAKTIMENGKGHYIEYETNGIPVLLEEILRISKQ